MRKAFVLSVFALSGAASALAFPPYDLPGVIWVAAAPALLAAVCVPFGVAAFGGLLFGVAQGALLLHWLFGLFGPGAAALFIIYGLSYIAIFGAVQQVAARWGTHALLWAAPPLWVAFEFLRSECWALRFAWFGLGYSQHADLPLLQLASVGGAYLLSLVIAGANGALAWFLERRSLRRLVVPVAALGLVAALHLAGSAMMRPARGDPSTGLGADFRVVGIEGEEWPLAHFLAQSERALAEHPGARLVVWPEYALPFRLSEDSPYAQRIAAFARERGVHVLLGATRAAGSTDFENTLFLFDPQGRIAGTQVKSVPVQFMKDGRSAAERAPLRVGDRLIGTGVCYDMNFPYVVRELVDAGAELLVFPTMDHATWGEVQHRQHAAMTALRAAEHRRWVVRVASSGISCVIDPYGRATLATRFDDATAFAADVGMRGDRTLYTRFGYWLPQACVLACIVLAALSLRRLTCK